ncbi:hypothetical protein CEXT_12101 [Caerostris extrusa]|uniref:Uncharacterized protein n=1 Tax=Caerostris extrusa TaxID=172846 RepID=A0AAV4R148_CAEEX|nr:hypothetical protein CEXT_12101 [Caerostris extrusa]
MNVPQHSPSVYPSFMKSENIKGRAQTDFTTVVESKVLSYYIMYADAGGSKNTSVEETPDKIQVSIFSIHFIFLTATYRR